MSEVRRCDRCSLIFPISDEGRSNVKGTVHHKYADGSTYEENIVCDFCGNCTNDMNGGNKVPMPAIANSDTPVQHER